MNSGQTLRKKEKFMSNTNINRRTAPVQLNYASRGYADTSRQLQPLMWLLAVSLLAVTSQAQNFTFSTFDVPGADSTELNGINRQMIGPIRSQSTIVGSYHDIGGTHAFSVSPGGLTTLPDPPNAAAAGQCAYCRDTEALGISNAGVIVGKYATDVQGMPTFLPFRFFSGTLTDPGNECGYATEAYGVNDQGAVVGA